MLPDHPLERTCRHLSEHRQLAFAHRVLGFLPQPRDCQYEASPEGIVIRGATESALEGPTELLREVYGEQIAIGPLTIRYRKGAGVEEPHMGVRVLCAAKDFEAVRRDLVGRDARILDEEVTKSVGVVRATAPLAKLLGYARDLVRLTAGSAREVMWLDHYEPCAQPRKT